MSFPGRREELRLTVRYTHPLLKLGWSECLLLTAAHTVHNDAVGHRDRLSEEKMPTVTVDKPSARTGWCNVCDNESLVEHLL